MTERTYVWLFWLLALSGVILDQAGKYGVFHALPPVDHFSSKERALFVGGVFELVTQFTAEPAKPPGSGVLARLNGRLASQGQPWSRLRRHLQPGTGEIQFLFALVSLVLPGAHRPVGSAATGAIGPGPAGGPGPDSGRHRGQPVRSYHFWRRSRFPAPSLPRGLRFASFQHSGRSFLGLRRLAFASSGLFSDARWLPNRQRPKNHRRRQSELPLT